MTFKICFEGDFIRVVFINKKVFETREVAQFFFH